MKWVCVLQNSQRLNPSSAQGFGFRPSASLSLRSWLSGFLAWTPPGNKRQTKSVRGRGQLVADVPLRSRWRANRSKRRENIGFNIHRVHTNAPAAAARMLMWDSVFWMCGWRRRTVPNFNWYMFKLIEYQCCVRQFILAKNKMYVSSFTG